MFFDLLQPVNLNDIMPEEGYSKSMLGSKIKIYSEEGSYAHLNDARVAIIGVGEDRASVNNKGCSKGPDAVRRYLYKLNEGSSKFAVADLGNVIRGGTVTDTYYALQYLCEELMKIDVIPLIIGGSQDLTYAQYKSYLAIEQNVELVVVDNKFSLGDTIDQVYNDNYSDEGFVDDAKLLDSFSNNVVTGECNSNSYFKSILFSENNNLFNYSNIGYQTYFVEQEAIRLLDMMNFDVNRLGMFADAIYNTESIIRAANLVSFNMSAIRQSDAPGNANAGPNGFYGQDACQMAYYAGMNEKLLSVGFYEFNPKFDRNGQTAHLLAQMIWCFLDGCFSRKNDYPIGSIKELTLHRTELCPIENYEIEFYSSFKTGRWWMKVPYPSKNINYMLPCDYSDYQKACEGEIPDRWIKTYNKLR